MRIGIDCRLPYYQMGGISRYVLHLLPALASIDPDNHYIIFHSRKDSRRYTPAAPQALNFRSGQLWTPSHHRLERWTLAGELAPHRLAVFHSPDFIPPVAGARRRVITVHDLNFLYYPQYLTEESLRYYAGQIQWAVEQADLIAADSEHTRRDLLDRLNVPPEKVTTIPLAAGPAFSEKVSTGEITRVLEKHRLPQTFVLFVGTLEPRKNLPLLLNVIARLRPTLDVPLVIVGGRGWLDDEIFSTVEQLDLSSRVHQISGISDQELAALYHAAGLLALPSHYEGFGFPPLEAMHCGCPVVVSNRASLPEIVGEAGLLLDPEEPSAWEEAVTLVLSDSEKRADMIAAGYKQAARFSWRRTAELTLSLYKNE